MYDYLMSIKRPKDNEPDDRDIDPDYYIYYIRHHGKQCDKIEPKLNKLCIRRKDNESPESPLTISYDLSINNNKKKNIVSSSLQNYHNNVKYGNYRYNNYENNKSFVKNNNSQVYKIQRPIELDLNNNFNYNYNNYPNNYNNSNNDSFNYERQYIDSNENNYIKKEPIRSLFHQKKVRYSPSKLNKINYEDIYVDPKKLILEKNENILGSKDYKDKYNMKFNDIFNYETNNKSNSNNYYNNNRYYLNQNDTDSDTKEVLNKVIPNYKLNQNNKKIIYDYNAQNNSDNRRYSPYINNYGVNQHYYF